jgi:hypothetical protein
VERGCLANTHPRIKWSASKRGEITKGRKEGSATPCVDVQCRSLIINLAYPFLLLSSLVYTAPIPYPTTSSTCGSSAASVPLERRTRARRRYVLH